MTNIFKESKKAEKKHELFQLAIASIEKLGWRVERIPGSGKSSIRRIVMGNESRIISIRTSQDTWIAFPRNEANDGWATLADVDYVVAASVDDARDPQFAQVHMIKGDEMRDRFNRAFNARKSAGHSLPLRRGIWVSLYHSESDFPVNRVGAGAGLANAPIARVALNGGRVEREPLPDVAPRRAEGTTVTAQSESGRLTIAEAKRLLARSLGVNEEDVRITVSG
jgi:hypothetical protein